MDFELLHLIPAMIFIGLLIARAGYYMLSGINAPSDVSGVFLLGVLSKIADRIRIRN